MTAVSRLLAPLGRAANRLPAPVAERVLPWKRRAFAEAGTARTEDAPTRLLIAPVNSAGQGHAWARAAERLPGVAAANFMYRDRGDVFDFPADQSVPVAYFAENRRWQRAQRHAIESRFTHVVVESGRPFVGVDVPVADQIRSLLARGVQVALLWHGSDIRDPRRHAAHEPDSPFHGAYADVEKLVEVVERNRALVGDLPLMNFVSTPDLLDDVPTAQWLPPVVDVGGWRASGSGKPLERRVPVVCHAPSRAGMKGTAAVRAAMQPLHDEGLIEFTEAVGLRSSQMRSFYGRADIVLDQFALGSYGVAACEAMAAGRVVVGHVSARVRSTVEAETSSALPIVEARAGELGDVIRTIVSERTSARRTARDGEEFVAAVHDGTRSASVLSTFLGAL